MSMINLILGDAFLARKMTTSLALMNSFKQIDNSKFMKYQKLQIFQCQQCKE